MKEFPHWSNMLRFSKLSGQWRCYTCHIFLRQMYGVFVLSWPEFPKFPKIFRKKSGKRNINNKKVTMRRDLRTSNKAALGRYLTQINWPLLFTPLVSCEEKWQVFQDVIHSGLDTIMPAKPVKICTADAPWMNESLKSLIMKRQKAFCAHCPDSAQFKYFRNLVNRLRKICRGKYYESKIQHLKGENPKRWWDEQNAWAA